MMFQEMLQTQNRLPEVFPNACSSIQTSLWGLHPIDAEGFFFALKYLASY
jgi:hypothetical protein